MIQNARFVKDYTLASEYAVETEKRGSPFFTVRAHILSEILRNTRRWRNGYESPASKAKKFGELYDCLLLTPKQWPERFCCTPATYTNKKGEQSKWRNDERIAEVAEWLEENRGKTVVSPDTNAAVHGALTVLRQDEMIADLIDGSQHQVWLAAEWQDKSTGLVVPIKALLDVVPRLNHPLFGDSIWDVKTTMNAGKRSFAGDACKYGYHRAAAWYLDLWNAATGEQRTQFGHIVQENFYPFEFRTPPPYLSQRAIELGRIEYNMALDVYCRALQTGEWPSYDRKSKEWPITEFPDWCFALDNVFDPIEEGEPEESDDDKEPELDIIP